MAAKIQMARKPVELKIFIGNSQTKYYKLKTKWCLVPYIACIRWTGFSFRIITHANIYLDIHVMILNDEYEDKYEQMSMKKNEKCHY